MLVRAGETVEPDTVIVQLSNPEVERAADAAALEVAAARAEYAAARLELESQRLDRRSSLAEARATAESARLQAVAEQRAFEKGAVSELQTARSKIEADQLGERAKIEEQRLAALDSAVGAQLEARQARLRQLERAAEERRLAAESLQVRAGIAGVVQSVPVQEGQQLAAGANVARVAKPGTLYAELRIPELDARDLAPGLPAVIDMRDRLVRGRVVRVDPAVTAGAVRVEVDFDEALPTQARADLSVDGTIAIETLEKRALRRPPGRRAVRVDDHGVPRAARRFRRRARAGEVRQGVREPDRRPRGPRARRHRGARGHDAVVRQGPHSSSTIDQEQNIPTRSRKMQDQAMISLAGVTKVFYTDDLETHALDGIHLDVAKGEFLSISGPSGCGKSTLLAILGLLDSSTEGKYLLDGQDVTALAARRAREGPQRAHRLHLPGLQPDRRPDGAAERRAAADLPRQDVRGRAPQGRALHALERVGMSHRVNHHPVAALRRPAAARRGGPRARRASPRSCWPTSRPGTSTRATARRS